MMQITDNLTLMLGLILVKFEKKILQKYPLSCSEKKSNLFFMKKKKKMAREDKHTKVKWLVLYFVHFNWSFFEISLSFISPKPSPKPSDVQLLSTRHVTKVHLLQKFLDPQKHALIDTILPTCGNLTRFSFTWKMCVQREMCIHFN